MPPLYAVLIRNIATRHHELRTSLGVRTFADLAVDIARGNLELSADEILVGAREIDLDRGTAIDVSAAMADAVKAELERWSDLDAPGAETGEGEHGIQFVEEVTDTVFVAGRWRRLVRADAAPTIPGLNSTAQQSAAA